MSGWSFFNDRVLSTTEKLQTLDQISKRDKARLIGTPKLARIKLSAIVQLASEKSCRSNKSFTRRKFKRPSRVPAFRE
ncbi:hypothetical protein PUN28_005103 [Cardiocondyla obscurior]|uniref:Uncharacterized protein n=1 Tax=Cardiocondyla obscurior TaxID=286306 RepID=A0AAW2GER0_9HYME